MLISSIYIQNFRKLCQCKIDFSEKTTLFVGANNSGKTSAMDALRKFLIKGESGSFVFNDLTITNRRAINEIGAAWIIDKAEKPQDLSTWENILPSMDIWFDVANTEFHYVAAIIPTLDWVGGRLGVRLSLLPKDASSLFEDYRDAYSHSRDTEKDAKNTNQVILFPKDLCDFIEKNLMKYFEIKTFLLDPLYSEERQSTDFKCECEEKNPLAGLIQIDLIPAQRGLADVSSTNDVFSLSYQLRDYYDRHLDVDKHTTPEDLATLSALQEAQKTFDETLSIKFKDSFAALERLGFPGISDPKITVESKFTERTAFEHESAVQYALSDDTVPLRLPEKYNGLGYQNLISIAFKLMIFRDDRVNEGKAQFEANVKKPAPLHLVLMEEPEAHLHVQVQQVLIKKAYSILTDSDTLRANDFKTQLVVSTHSSHIAQEVSFKDIRYFKRIQPSGKQISTSDVVNLCDTFGEDEKTEKFVHRYLRVNHCDLFFADAVIFVEGTSETVLVPNFIKQKQFEKLSSRYVTILPVGGSHSYRFKPLVEKLGILTLVITDLDPINRKNRTSQFPVRGSNELISSNPSLKGWELTYSTLDDLLNLSSDEKILANGAHRIAYQTPVNISYKHTSMVDVEGEAIAATFEDSLIYANLKAILSLSTTMGLVGKTKEATKLLSTEEFNKAVYSIIHKDNTGKVSLALDLIYELETVTAPPYIQEGLMWLQEKLCLREDLLSSGGKIHA